MSTAFLPAQAAAQLRDATSVVGTAVSRIDLYAPPGSWSELPWDSLPTTRRPPGAVLLGLRVHADLAVNAVRIPTCGGRGTIRLDGQPVRSEPRAPVVLTLSPGPHRVTWEVRVSTYERRVACGEPPTVGHAMAAIDGVRLLDFPSPHRAGGLAVVVLPPGHDQKKPATVLLGTHPWNGDPWTYAAYTELLDEAASQQLVLLMPSGLGNSLYTADAEDEVFLALNALSAAIAVDPRAVSIWGASMGGAGATTLGFHRPDRFATITSYFGDSKYDVTTYVRSLLASDPTAHTLNALDIVDNARHVPVWLIHGDDDHVSPLVQSTMLYDALRERGFNVRFDRVAGAGHEGALVARFLREVIRRAAKARVPHPVTRVSYTSVRPDLVDAYGVHLLRLSNRGDATVDLERRPDGIHVRRASGLRGLVLTPGWLGATPGTPVTMDDGSSLEVTWARP
ncbi:MAG: prolyl oligopeptidase family serine peptidase [Myxococcales bacterium]